MTAFVLLLVIVTGTIAGLRTAIPLMALAWAAHWGWLRPGGPFSSVFVESARHASFAYFTTGVAIVELATDKHAKRRNALKLRWVVARVVLGGWSSAMVAEAGGLPTVLGAVVGSLSAVAAGYGAHKARVAVGESFKIPNFVVSLIEDVLSIAAAFVVISQLAN